MLSPQATDLLAIVLLVCLGIYITRTRKPRRKRMILEGTPHNWKMTSLYGYVNVSLLGDVLRCETNPNTGTGLVTESYLATCELPLDEYLENMDVWKEVL